ncbi:MAG: acyl carrier protein [Flavobacteriia bacterium]|nr:acyl carrier protein [Flavobacteriia bacterium]
MNHEKLMNQLETVFRIFFKNDSIQLNENSTADDIAHWDSLSHLELIHAIEINFQIVFNFDEVLSFKNVGDMVYCISYKLK